MIRAALFLASAVSTGMAIGRNILSKEIEKKKRSVIEDAGDEVRARIKLHAEDYLRESVRLFLRRNVFKAFLLTVLWALFRTGILPPSFIPIAVALTIGALALYDAYRVFPTLKFGFVELRRYGWRPKRTISELVAAHVFEQVLSEMENADDRWKHDLLLTLAGKKRDDFTRGIAEELADIARTTTWDDLRPFVLTAVGQVAVVLLLYSAFAFLLLTHL
jgi:hypothetical protein